MVKESQWLLTFWRVIDFKDKLFAVHREVDDCWLLCHLNVLRNSKREVQFIDNREVQFNDYVEV